MSSPVIDFEDICDALAARFVAATLGTPSGEAAMVKSYSEPPEAVPQTPSHILEVQDGEIIANAGQWEHHFNIDGLLLISRRTADTIRPEEKRRRWLPYLLHAAVDAWKLGIGAQSGWELKSAIPTGWQWDEYSVSTTEFHAIRVHWQIIVYEYVSPTP